MSKNKDEIGDKCHVSKGPLCVYKKFEDMGDDFLRAYMAFTELTRGPLLKNNEDCVRKVINRLYWKANDKINGSEEEEDGQAKYIFLAGAIVVVFITALILFTLYFKRQIASESAQPAEDTKKTEALAYKMDE